MMEQQLEAILPLHDQKVLITNSRRTPEATNGFIDQRCETFFRWEQTERKWLPTELARSERVWVTRDSMSMIYEALTSGAQVHVLDVPLAGKSTRVTRAIDLLIEHGLVGTLDNSPSNTLQFHEAARVSEMVLAQLPFR